jgi:hypothetical protein
MALTVTTDLTDIDLAESATPWTTGALDPAKFVQGQNSIGWYASKNSRSVNGVSSKSIAHSAGDHLYWWNASDVISVAEPQTTGTTTASGVTIRVTLSDGAYREWHVAGSDTWDGGWRCFVVDLGHTGTHLYASSGTWSTANNITDVDLYLDLSNSGNIRNVPANNYADAIRVGTGITAYNTSAADAAFDFADIAAIADNTTNKYGVFGLFEPGADGVFGLQGNLTIGDSGTNHVDFLSTDETVVFLQRDGTDGYGLVADTLYDLSFVGNSTGTDQDVYLGTKVGTGDTMTGRNGTQIRSGGSAVNYSVDFSDANLHNVGWYGCTIAGATGGVSATADPTTLFELASHTFDGCDEVDMGGATARTMNFLNSTATSTEGALLWTEGETDIQKGLFVNNSNGIRVPSLSANMSFTDMTFSGNTYDVRYEDTDSWNLNYTGGTTPTVNNTSTGTLTPAQSVTITLKDVVSGSQCSVHAENDGTELMNEAAAGGDVTEGYSGTLPRDVIVRVRKASSAPKYVNWQSTAQIVSGTGLTLYVSQILDGIIE